MTIQAPTWAMIAAALDGVGDSHLPEGVHVRALPSSRLGLPATPLEVTRAIVPQRELLQIARKDGVVWIDSHGDTLTVPFEVKPGNPVVGYFPDGDHAVWAQLEPRASTEPPIVRPPITRPPITRPPITPIPTPRPVPLTVPGALAAGTIAQAVARPLHFEAVADTVNGPAVIQADAAAPYVLAHWHIPRVRVSGSGWVGGIRWVDAVRVQRRDYALWELWSLPVRPAPRYQPTPDAEAEARRRVQDAAVIRQPLHVAWTAPNAGSAPPAGPVDAEQRVGQVKGDLDRWLEVLLHDLAKPTWDLKDTQTVAKQTPTSEEGTMGMGIEKFLLVASIDPDTGHYLGLGDVDRRAKAEPGSLAIYRIRGLFRFNPAAWSWDEMASLYKGYRADREQAVEGFPQLQQYGVAPPEEGPFLDLFQYAIAVIGQPAQGMQAPQLLAPDERGWLSAPPPPDVRRAVRLVANGFHAPALAAVAASDQYGERTLHAFPGGRRMQFGSSAVPGGTPLPWVVSQPADPAQGGQGRFEDRNAPESSVTYRIARGDWFGRWSGWGRRDADPPPRAVPARPAILLDVRAPVFADPPAPPPAGLLSSTIELRIPIPGLNELPAGGAQLKELVLYETFGAAAATVVTYALNALPAGVEVVLDGSSVPGHPQHLLKITRTGPALPPAGKSRVSYTAIWRDVLDHESAEAYPAAKTVIDPRPPAAPVIVRELAYTSRPDSLGHARAAFSFDGVDGVGYRIYYSNETTLLKALSGINPGLASNIANTALINDRAGALVDHRQLFGWDHFELVTPEPLYRGADGKVHFVHRVSGGLRVAVFYRVVAEGPHGGLSELSASSMFAFGVPSAGGPAKPVVSLVSGADANPIEDGVRLRVKVPRGATRPAAWRLRRTTTPLADPLRMPIVLDGALAAPPADAPEEVEAYTFDIVAGAPLKPWVNYRFVVEVRGAPPPGAVDVLGEWGEASAPVKLAVMPPQPPKAPQQVSIASEAGGVRVTVKPQALENWGATQMGSYLLETWRSAAGARPVRVELLYSWDEAGQSWQGIDPTPLPAGVATSIAVRILDPLGRASAAVSSNIL